jgi:hypothetical protein
VQPLFLLAGAAAYALGWIYLPDAAWFRRWFDRQMEARNQMAEQAEVGQFLKQRAQLMNGLSPEGLSRYQALAAVCREIEAARTHPLAGEPGVSPEPADPRLFKLEELMWTFLRLLTIEDSLARFLSTEAGENIPLRIHETEQEIGRLSTKLDGQKEAASGPDAEAQLKLRDSRLELLDVLKKRQQRVDQAQTNLRLVRSEQERLEQQIKLLRADALAIKNTQTVTSRIDATVAHLDQTNRWLAELDEYRDLVGNLPQTERRLGFGTENLGGPLNSAGPPRPRESAKQRI